MKKTSSNVNNNKFSSSLEDLDFSDDLALFYSKAREHIQTKVNNLQQYRKMTGL